MRKPKAPKVLDAITDVVPAYQTQLIAAVKRLKNAETEYHRAINTGEQPRLSNAGTRYQLAKWNLYRQAGLTRGEQGDEK